MNTGRGCDRMGGESSVGRKIYGTKILVARWASTGNHQAVYRVSNVERQYSSTPSLQYMSHMMHLWRRGGECCQRQGSFLIGCVSFVFGLFAVAACMMYAGCDQSAQRDDWRGTVSLDALYILDLEVPGCSQDGRTVVRRHRLGMMAMGVGVLFPVVSFLEDRAGSRRMNSPRTGWGGSHRSKRKTRRRRP